MKRRPEDAVVQPCNCPTGGFLARQQISSPPQFLASDIPKYEDPRVINGHPPLTPQRDTHEFHGVVQMRQKLLQSQRQRVKRYLGEKGACLPDQPVECEEGGHTKRNPYSLLPTQRVIEAQGKQDARECHKARLLASEHKDR